MTVKDKNDVSKLAKLDRHLTIADLGRFQAAFITGFSTDSGEFETRLREIGFTEGDRIEVQHIGLFGGSPLNIKLHGTSIAMRPSDARKIIVELDTQ